MSAVVQSFLTGFPTLLLHFSVTLSILAAGIWLYMLITPHKELALIREGNTAAAISLSGAVLGLAIPLAFSMSVSVNVLDILIWGVLALVIQLACFWAMDKLMGELSRRIDEGEMGPAILLAGVKLSVAVVNAAAISG